MACSICAALRPELTNDTENGMPTAFHQLVDLSPANYRDEILKECPQCGAVYEYCQWTPGGSDDAMQTTVHERLLKIENVQAWFIESIDECAKVAARGHAWITTIQDALKSARANWQRKNH